MVSRYWSEQRQSLRQRSCHYGRVINIVSLPTDPTELVLIVERFKRVVSEGAEPPSWMKAWGHHVTNQPRRTSVDPQALGAACTLRAAGVMAEAKFMPEARALYQLVLARYSNREWAYYVDRAKAALAGLQDSIPAVVAFRPDPLLSR